MLLLFLYFSLLFLYFCTTFSSIGTSTKKVQTFILFLVLVEQKVEVLNWAVRNVAQAQKVVKKSTKTSGGKVESSVEILETSGGKVEEEELDTK